MENTYCRTAVLKIKYDQYEKIDDIVADF